MEIGTRFRKQLNKNNFVECEVFDIYKVVSTSTRTGHKNERLVYYAISNNYGMGKPFEVAKSTISRGLM